MSAKNEGRLTKMGKVEDNKTPESDNEEETTQSPTVAHDTAAPSPLSIKKTTFESPFGAPMNISGTPMSHVSPQKSSPGVDLAQSSRDRFLSGSICFPKDAMLGSFAAPFQDLVKATVQRNAMGNERGDSPEGNMSMNASVNLLRNEGTREKVEKGLLELLDKVRNLRKQETEKSVKKDNNISPRSDFSDFEGDKGEKLSRVIRSAIDDADEDSEESPVTKEDIEKTCFPTSKKKQGFGMSSDWRNDGDLASSSNLLPSNQEGLNINTNRILDAIVGMGKSAQMEDEMKWVFTQSELLSLLEEEDFEYVMESTLRREYLQGEVILEKGERAEHVYCIVWGEVLAFQEVALDEAKKEKETGFQAFIKTSRTQSHSPKRGIAELSENLLKQEEDFQANDFAVHCGTLLPGQIFAVESCLFNSPTQFSFKAGSATRKTVLAMIPINCFFKALARNARFAQGTGSYITSAFDVFGPIRKFCRYVFSPVTAQNEYLPLWSILESYVKIENVIHTKLLSKEIDTGAWGYAINRLPNNVTTTFCFDLVHALPPFIATRMRDEARGAENKKKAESNAKVSHYRNSITFIRTNERRRCTWHLGMEGKTLVLLRDGFTDLLDFLTMLCVHIMESNKLRGRIQGMVHPPAIDVLDEYLRQRDSEMEQGIVVSADEEKARIKEILRDMPLSEEEQQGLYNNWKNDTLLRIYEVMMHREEFNVRVDPSVSRKFQTNPFHEWALNLRRHVMEKLGLDPSATLPENVTIDVISSNTHCMKNLLGTFARRYKKEILEYIEKNEKKRLGSPEEWNNIDDMVYIAMPAFVQNCRPDLKDELASSYDSNGITVIQDTAMTGLQVDVIPVYRIDFDSIDETIRDTLKTRFEGQQKGCNWSQICKAVEVPVSTPTTSRRPTAVTESTASPDVDEMQEENKNIKKNGKTNGSAGESCKQYRRKQHFILNMDFAFGAQAEGIARALFSAFGKRIRSVNVMGKAGGLVGKRGDIQLASHVLLSKSSLILEDNQDELRNCRNHDFTQERLKELAGPKVAVHHGKVLTVTGTMLQNVQLLRYYKYVWNCVGTEMEGSYFARVIEDFYRQGIAHPHLTTRFAYYTSDLPLAQSEAEEEFRRTHKVSGAALTLSAPMTPQEGVPPLYAIARGILENVLMHSLT